MGSFWAPSSIQLVICHIDLNVENMPDVTSPALVTPLPTELFSASATHILHILESESPCTQMEHISEINFYNLTELIPMSPALLCYQPLFSTHAGHKSERCHSLAPGLQLWTSSFFSSPWIQLIIKNSPVKTVNEGFESSDLRIVQE